MSNFQNGNQDISLFPARRSTSVRHRWPCQQPGCHRHSFVPCTLYNYKYV